VNALQALVHRLNASRYAITETWSWIDRSFAAPSPNWVKRRVLLRNGISGGTWIETGTYFGDTTMLMAHRGDRVLSIEPEPILHARAQRRFASRANVEILLGESERVFPGIMAGLEGDATFWLDGHYSGGVTHQAGTDTPIRLELGEIARRLPSLGRVCVMVDDVRCFVPGTPGCEDYPSLDWLVDWCRSNGLVWHIEHDILVARR
jgi:hypothetical protein